MLTTPNLASFLLVREGFRKHAYDDAQPNVTLTEDTEIKGTLTIGVGTTHYPDGQPVRWNDTVSKQEALDYLQHYIQTVIEPALENLIHVPLEPHQYDALGSLLYQYGEPEVSGWRLINRINRGDDWRNIILEWVTGTVMWMGRPLFWGRRVAEVLMFMGLDWRAGDNVPAESNIIDVVEAMKPPEKPKALPAPEPPSPKPEPAMNDAQKKARSVQVPDNWDDLTPSEQVAWLNGDKKVALKPKKVEVKTSKSPIPVDHIEYLDDEAKAEVKVKKVKDSQRGKGFAKKEVGKVAGTVAVGGMMAEQVGIVEPIVKFASNYSINTIGIVLGLTMAGSVIYWAYGEWQEKKGRDEADTLLG